MAKVTLDMETFKALASQTRLQVLRALDARRKTLSELSKELELNKATVHEHLQILTTTGLVKKRDDEGRKWIYYELSWQGERLLHPQETTTFAVLLGLGVAAAGGGVAMLGRSLQWWMAEQEMRGMDEDSADAPAGPESQQTTAQDDRQADNGTDQADTAQRSAADEPSQEADGSGGWLDMDTGDGILSFLLFGTAVLLMVLAFVVRRSRRA